MMLRDIRIHTEMSAGVVQEIREKGNEICMIVTDDGTDSKKEIRLRFQIPILGIAGIWHPSCGPDRRLKANWDKEFKSSAVIGAPVVCLFGEAGSNRMTFAVSEIRKTVYMKAGVYEECGMMDCDIRISIAKKELPYEYALYVNDDKTMFYSKALQEVSMWWEKYWGLTCFAANDTAMQPMYSTWYSYHQEVGDTAIEEECRLAYELGFKTVIVDDGWQTEDNSRGYAYCGDWKASERKMHDMQKHVARVHQIGMKYILWFSVPFLGRYSKAWEAFQDKILCYEDRHKAGILDLRYPDVREYLVNTYENAVKDWDIDGLKLDFIDEFYLRSEENEGKEGMDIDLIEDAVCQFLLELRDRLTLAKPDIMIEFRQGYVGPVPQMAGNIIRVMDCPASGTSNRIGCVDIRLLSSGNAVHSDMLMWHQKEAVPDVVRQLMQSMFCTVQVSVRLAEQTKEVKRALRYWISFMAEYQQVLQKGELTALEPQHLYPVLKAARGHTQIQGIYSAGTAAGLQAEMEETIYLNAAMQETLYVKSTCDSLYQVEIRNCSGEVTEMSERRLGIQICEFHVGQSGMLRLLRRKKH